MRPASWQHYLAAALLIFALTLLGALLLRPGLSPYVSVDELLARGTELRARQVRLAGYVVGDIGHSGDGLATFRVEARGASVPVLCSDVMPAALNSGDAVLLDGVLGDDDVFRAHRLLTQCASRYRERLGENPSGR